CTTHPQNPPPCHLGWFCSTAPMVPSTKRNLSLGGHVGFDSLPDQLVSKSVTQGFSFNILCVGEHSPASSSWGWNRG
uniref:Uncharacterized protein n=1 Tax=Pavo cristatus TaxID=9049 RepID=A0A8C9FQS6_PAVCR